MAGGSLKVIFHLTVWRVIRPMRAAMSSQGLRVMRLTNPSFSLMAATPIIRIRISILEQWARSDFRDVRHFTQHLDR